MAYNHCRHQVIRSYSNIREIRVYLAFIRLTILKPVFASKLQWAYIGFLGHNRTYSETMQIKNKSCKKFIVFGWKSRDSKLFSAHYLKRTVCQNFTSHFQWRTLHSSVYQKLPCRDTCRSTCCILRAATTICPLRVLRYWKRLPREVELSVHGGVEDFTGHISWSILVTLGPLWAGLA